MVVPVTGNAPQPLFGDGLEDLGSSAPSLLGCLPEIPKGNGIGGQTNGAEVGYMGQAIEDKNTHPICLRNRHRGYKHEL